MRESYFNSTSLLTCRMQIYYYVLIIFIIYKLNDLRLNRGNLRNLLEK